MPKSHMMNTKFSGRTTQPLNHIPNIRKGGCYDRQSRFTSNDPFG